MRREVSFRCLGCGKPFQMNWEPQMRNATCNVCRTHHLAEDNSGNPRLVRIFDWKIDLKEGPARLKKVLENGIELPEPSTYDKAGQYLEVCKQIEKIWEAVYNETISRPLRNKIIDHFFNRSKIAKGICMNSYWDNRLNTVRKDSKLYKEILQVFEGFKNGQLVNS